MKDNEKYADLKHKRFAFKLYTIFILAGILLVLVVLKGFYAFKSWDSDVVAKRFILQNKKLNSEVGGIDKIVGIGNDTEKPTQSQIIARRLKSGEYPVIPGQEKGGDSQEVRLMSDDYGVWKKGRAVGKEIEIEFEIYLEKQYMDGYERGLHYKVSKVKFRDKEGEWKEQQIRWFENFFSLF
jgi:hypothetical protein